MVKNYKKYFYFVLFIVICSIGDSLFFKAGIGVSPYEALTQTTNYITHIKIGTITMCINIIFIILQIIISRKIDIKIILQIFMCMLAGYIINFIIYTLLAGLKLNYIGSLICLMISICFQATGVGLLMSLNLVVYPLEGFCNALSGIIHVDFPKIRQGADIVFIIVCLACSFLLHVDYAIREGTVISMLCFSPIMAFVMKKMDPIIKKINA